MNNAKKLESLYKIHGDIALNGKIFINKGLEPAFTNYHRTDGVFEFDDWTLREIGEDLYKIIPPKTKQINEQ